MAFELMNPAGNVNVRVSKVANRLRTLKGARLGLLDNGKTNAAKFLNMVADILVREYGVGAVKMFSKDTLAKPASRELLHAIIADSDFVVTGLGDCGSCSTNSVHDSIEIEKLGIPAVAVCTEPFLPGLDALTRMRGMPDYKFAVSPHPLGVLFDDELKGRAQLVVPQIVQIVLGSAESAQRAATTASAPVTP